MLLALPTGTWQKREQRKQKDRRKDQQAPPGLKKIPNAPSGKEPFSDIW
jgi:hypothetical protein